MGRRAVLAAAALLAVAPVLPARAENPDRGGVYVDVWPATVNASGRIDGATTGSDYDLVGDTGLDEHALGFEVGGWYHPAGRHRVRFAAFRFASEGSVDLPRALGFGGAVVPAGTPVRSSLDLRSYDAAYAWSFVNLEIVDVALTAGADWLDARNGIVAQGKGYEADLTGPIPVVGLALEVQPVKFVRVYAEGAYADWTVSGLAARVRDLRIRGEFYVGRTFGLGVGYRDLEARAERTGHGLLDAHLRGFQAYLLVRL